MMFTLPQHDSSIAPVSYPPHNAIQLSSTSARDSDCSSSSVPPAGSPTSAPTAASPLPSAHKFAAVHKPYLPPCKVCGGKAAGLHYCVNTCHSCRMFFRRMLQCPSPPKCQQDNDCVIEYRSIRTTCATCRYNKCLAAGMRINNKKVGRYTHTRRTHNIEEVRNLQLRLQVTTNDHRLLTEAERHVQLDLLAEGLTSVFVKKHHNTPEYIAETPRREQRITAIRNLEEGLIGRMAPLSYEDYSHIYYSTGIDVDSRRTYLSTIFPNIDVQFIEYLQFIRFIPGFRHLPIEDQAAICRANIPCDNMINCYHIYNDDLKLWTIGHVAYRMQDLATFMSMNTLDQLASTFTSLQQLELTLEERAALNAYMILTADADVSPEGRRMLSAMTDTVSELLYRVIQRNHDDDTDAFFAKLISVILKMHATCCVVLEEYQRNMDQYCDLDWPRPARVTLGSESFDKMVDEFQQMCKIVEGNLDTQKL